MKKERRDERAYQRAIFKELHPLIPVGAQFGRWTVLENDLYKDFDKSSSRACRVRCRCGTEGIRAYGDLRSGNSPSCGCKSRERSVDAVWNSIYAQHRCRGQDFHLTVPQMKAVMQLNCVYCGSKPSNVFRRNYKIRGKLVRGISPEMDVLYSGLDRVDSSKGYILGNVVPCCYPCNAMKSKLPVDEFFALIERIRLHNSTSNKVLEQAAALFEQLS